MISRYGLYHTWNFDDGTIQSGLLITATLTLTNDQGLINSTLQPVTIY